MALLVWPLFSLLAIAAMVLALWRVPPALAHRKHERTLANIARLERLNGYGPAAWESALSDSSMEQLAAQVQRAQEDSLWTGAERDPPQSERVFATCGLCHRRVALNAGRCQTTDKLCAKLIYRTSARTGEAEWPA